MIPGLISILGVAFAALGKLFEWLYARKLVDAGKTQQQLEALANDIRYAQIAVAAREAIRAATARYPDSLPDDNSDPFLRD